MLHEHIAPVLFKVLLDVFLCNWTVAQLAQEQERVLNDLIMVYPTAYWSRVHWDLITFMAFANL